MASTSPANTDLERLPDLERQVPGADRRATELLVNLIKTAGRLEGAVGGRLRESGLTPAAFNTLMVVRGADEPLCPSEIGERLLVTRGTVTGLLDSLERRGLIERQVDPEDRRMQRIQLTPKARTLLREVAPPLHRWEKELLAHVPARDKEALVRLLGKVLGGLPG